MLSVLVNKPLGDRQSVFLGAHQAPSHCVKGHIENMAIMAMCFLYHANVREQKFLSTPLDSSSRPNN